MHKAIRSVAPLALMVAGMACGGPTENNGGPGEGSETGLLVDAPVQGVSFRTTSGAEGTTGAGGTYTYNPDDLVTFSLGGLTLGAITANGILTPIDIANGSANRLQNLLVLFQSLDQDGIPGNGLTIPPAAAAAITAGLNLDMSPISFASSANTILVAAMAAGGIARPIVTTNQANAEFRTQLLALLGFDTWVLSAPAVGIVVRTNAVGDYLMGQVGTPGNGGQPGLEFGTVTAAGFDPLGYWFTPSNVLFDSNGDWGLSTTDVTCERFTVYGDRLLSRNCQGQTNASFLKMPNRPSDIVGAWVVGSATDIHVRMFAFFPNGQFMMLDPVGDTSASACGGPGVEYGSYTHTGNTLRIATPLSYDTNGCAGLSNSSAATPAGMALTVNGTSATATIGGTPVTLVRVSK